MLESDAIRLIPVPRCNTPAASAALKGRRKGGVYGQAMAEEYRYPNRRGVDREARQIEHPPHLLPQTALFARHAVGVQHVHLGNDIECDLPPECTPPRPACRSSMRHRLPGKLIHAASSATRYRLIGRNLDAREASRGMQGRKRGGERHAGAARQRNQTARAHRVERAAD